MFRLKLHFAMKKNFTIKTRPPYIFFRRNTPEGYPKNRSKLTIEKKTTKHSQCSPPSPHSPPPTCRITARGRERHTTWLKESLKGSGGVWKPPWKAGRKRTHGLPISFQQFVWFIDILLTSKIQEKIQKEARKGSLSRNKKKGSSIKIHSESHHTQVRGPIFPQQTHLARWELLQGVFLFERRTPPALENTVKTMLWSNPTR